MDFQPKNQESSSKNQVYLGDCPARRPHSGIGRVNECYQVDTRLASPAAAGPPSPPAARQRIPAALTEAALCAAAFAAAALATAEPVTAACNPCLRASAALQFATAELAGEPAALARNPSANPNSSPHEPVGEQLPAHEGDQGDVARPRRCCLRCPRRVRRGRPTRPQRRGPRRPPRDRIGPSRRARPIRAVPHTACRTRRTRCCCPRRPAARAAAAHSRRPRTPSGDWGCRPPARNSIY